MKKEIAEIWVKALESGKYKQTKGALKKKDKYCCLGVLCDLSEQGEFINAGLVNGNIDISHEVYVLPNGNKGASELPYEVVKWADMSDSMGCFIKTADSETLSELNDSGKSFTEIAEIIRNNYQSL